MLRENMKNTIAKIVLILALVAGSLAFLYSILHPSEPVNVQFIGFSYRRLAFMAVDLILLVLISLATIKAFRNEVWLDKWGTRIFRFITDIPENTNKRSFDQETSDPSFKNRWYRQVVLVLLMLSIFTPVTYSMVFLSSYSDYSSHIYWAEEMRNASLPDVQSVISHSGWQLLVILIQQVTRSTFAYSGFMASMLSIVLMAFLIFHFVKPALLRQKISLWWGVLISIGLNLVTPILLLVYRDMRFYFGYVGLITYHNPTIILLRPLALMQFIVTIRGFRETTSRWIQVIPAVIISLLATYVKPSFAICILPAIGLIMAYRLITKNKINWRMLLVGIILPTVGILVWQFLLSYNSAEKIGIIISPLGVMSQLSEYLLAKFILSILFPLFVLILYNKKAVRDIRLVLGWLIFIFGAFCTYFLAESGTRFLHGNFTWSGEIAALILFCISTVFFIEQVRTNKFKTWLLSIIWFMHGISGILYYVYAFLWKDYS
jgi:hypothetical protein